MDRITPYGAPRPRTGYRGPETMQLGWLQTFVSVYRTGSFTKAARDLDITQPAVTQQIRGRKASWEGHCSTAHHKAPCPPSRERHWPTTSRNPSTTSTSP
ncbi:helix-turn-helix domain-containing protein [Streptomyces sp. CB01201]|uniref:helix-turn-helix domain-containing protein n=1 Tax=Streptomyces sp. CB01201 TaxID=2020324 RepID=UPI000C27C1F5